MRGRAFPSAHAHANRAPLHGWSRCLAGRSVLFVFNPAFIGCRDQAKRIPHSVQVVVRDNNIDQALKALKKKLQREGVFREMKLRRHYEKPSERRAREAAEAVRRARKVERKRLEREGF
jgi:small subunit ribosomal protein S21